LEQEGTYPLPEAQVDRFMMKVVVSYPNRSEERAILDAMATTAPMVVPRHVVTGAQIIEARRVVDALYVDDKIRDYIVDVVLATRPPTAAALKIDGYIQTGASPRATIALTLAARAMAFLSGRHFVVPQDVKAVAMDVLRHRVSITYEAEAENISPENVIEKILNTLPVP
jgi:MoxR-like ATPase